MNTEAHVLFQIKLEGLHPNFQWHQYIIIKDKIQKRRLESSDLDRFVIGKLIDFFKKLLASNHRYNQTHTETERK